MAMTINTNIQSLNAQRNLTSSQSSLSTSMQRLSSGMRINSAKDDAAGLAIATRMGTQITGLNQAQRNANDGVSLAQTAEGALGTIGTNLQRIRELAVQSRNATNSTEDRAALQKEVSQLTDEVDRVSKDTSFNSTKLLDGSFTSKAFQVGANQGQLIEIAAIVDAKTSSLGSWTSVNKAAVSTGVAPTGTVAPGKASLDFSGIAIKADGNYDAFSFTVDGTKIDVLASTTGSVGTPLTATDVATAAAAALGANVAGITGAVNAGKVDLTNTKATSVTISGAVSGTVDAQGATFTPITGAALTINGQNIQVGAATSANQRSNDLLSAINGNSTLKASGVSASLVDGKLSVKSENANLVIGGAATAADTGLTAATSTYVAGTSKVGFASVDVSSIEGADNAILAMDAALKSVNSARADLGAIQNRFESVVSNLSVNSENLSASKSRIMDADFASETANLSRSQILQQAGTAMVAQANQLPQGVLSLLR